MTIPRLGISIVTYHSDAAQFLTVLRSLDTAVLMLDRHLPHSTTLTIVDNGNDAASIRAQLPPLSSSLSIKVEAAGKNIGYGRAHNKVVIAADTDFHLIMNPDVIVHEECLCEGLRYLTSTKQVVAVSPAAFDGSGNILYLCKKFPALLDLFLRGFAPKFIKAKFAERLNRYENRKIVEQAKVAEVDLISGCFMLCKTAELKTTGGFNKVFFLYFEDFALSLELGKQGSLVYLPACKITHFGGNASRKGLRHVGYFLASCIKFFNIYGWKLV